MESNEDGDLIDLDNSEVCVPRRSLHTDTASEEQEHLLDVCPPKLEQKLSLTVKHELTSSATDNGNILVTLGHDQVVPIRKRIDVVSSDTIKRVRDITRNLEPMMTQSAANSNLCDTVDHGSESSLERGYKRHETDEETYEARAISNAFDFLAEHEAEEEDEGERKVRGILKDSRGSRLTNRESSNVIINADLENGPANDFVLVTSNQVDSKVSWHRLDPIGAVSRTKRRAVKCRRDRGNSHDEGQQETKRRSIDENEKRRRSRRSRRNDHRQRGSWNIDRTEEDSTFSRVNSRKSVSLEECCVPFASDSSDVLRRSDFVDEEEAEENDEEEEQTDDDDDVDKEEEESSVIRTPEDVCSSNCSEVDWSWLEEVESGGQAGRKGDPSVNETLELEGTTRDSSVGRRRGGGGDSSRQDEASLLSLAMSVVVTGNSLATGSLGCPSGSVRLSAADTNVKNVVQSSATRWTVKNENATMHRNASNEAIDRENHAVTTSSSWVRASMRRLRHLRLPESSARQRTSQVEPTSDPASNVSAPNSLPDIALIAPEILAAQTNSSSMSIGSGTRSCSSSRPLSAPARNSGNHGVGTPRRFTRQYGVGVPSSRSRCSSSMVAPDNPATRDAPFSLSSLSSSSSQSPTSSSPAPLQTSSVNLPSVSTPNSSSPTSSNCQPHVVVPAPSSTSSSSGQNSSVASSTTTNISDATMSAATTCSSSFGPTTNVGGTPQRTGARRICERQRGVDRDGNRGGDDDDDENPLGRWPHALSPALACLGCTLGLYNISRFAILSIQFGANFIVQFLMLSLTLGIPLLTLQVCLGQRLAAGSVDMWKISPLFQGVGIALLTAQAFIGIYGIVGVSWMFVYFRDSFITKQDRYRWAEPFLLYREDSRPTHNTSTTYKLYETVPDYFSGVVLQRHHLNDSDPSVITLKFQVAFNLAVVWMIVFVSLSKGLRSYGKVVYVFTLVPVFGTLILCTKLLGLTPPGSVRLLFPATVWSEFFINGKSWVAASTEVFLTWGLLGAAAMQIAAHNKHKHLLQRDTSLVVVLTFVVLLLAAFLANTCVQILRHHGFIYTTSSFERISGYTFMRMVSQPAPQWYSSTPERFMTHASFIIGQRVTRPSADLASESGYQVLRLSTELVPATLALLGTEQVSPFWAVLFYFILILFGIAQQLAIWHCVITGIMAINTKMMKLWETTITFFSCACAYILGLPMATELGIYVIYYLDYTIGGAWWIMVLYLVQVGAVFAVRGRPHSGEAVVAELFPPTGRCLRHWAGPLLSFTWNVILPVTLMVLSITVFKNGRFRELYSYRRANREYWSLWARQLGATIQLIPILMIPAVAIIQTCRYLNNGPPDIFDRIQLLYRPSLDPEDPREVQMQIGNESNTSIHGNGILPATTDIPFEDPPPKYTPPPSYTTATGVRIAKMLRQSFRRSVRRIANVLGESSAPRQRPALQPPPPDYATVLVEMNQSTRLQNVAIHVTDPRPDVITNIGPDCNDTRHRSNTIDRMTRIGVVDRCTIERTHSTLDRAQRSSANPSSVSANLTAADVANLLRSSIRRGTARTQQSLRRSFCREESTAAVSVENLVEAAAPIGQDSLILPKDLSLVPDERISENNDDNKTANEMETSVSVI